MKGRLQLTHSMWAALFSAGLWVPPAAAQTYDVLKAFRAEGVSPIATLIAGTDGNLYGTTQSGGANGGGTIFKIDTDGAALTTLFAFAFDDGAIPVGALTQGQDGYLYGTTSEGGANGYGTVFKIDTGGAALITLHDFSSTDGAFPLGALMQGQDGYLYGTTQKGGASDAGTVFRIDASGTALTTLHSFSSTDGAFPDAGLIEGTDGNLYGTTEQGGENFSGTVFKIDTDGSTLTTLHGFAAGDGGAPEARLVQGTDGYLYGTTQWGGANGEGTVFKIDTSGSGFTMLHSFAFSDGGEPLAGLIQCADGNLYGTTTAGGASGVGTVFRIDTTGSAFATLHQFAGSDGERPGAGLLEGSDGNLYGATPAGGAGGSGTIFRIDKTGSAFVTLHDFGSLDGSEPFAGVIQAADGYVYGTTRYGGAHGYGTVFRMDSAGSTFTTLHSFAYSDGANPTADLVQGADGTLYGTTLQGGAPVNGRYGVGTIFKIDTGGSAFTTLHTFRSGDGLYPQELIQGTDGKLYGTVGGPVCIGCSGHGRVFKISTNGSAFTPLHDFMGTDGANPTGRLVQGSDGQLYGTTLTGGASDNGTIFTVGTNGNAFATLHDFAGGEGINPEGGLIQAADGNLYGITSQGGENGLGTVLKVDTNGSTLTTLHSFAGSDGANPIGGLLQGADGNLYGTTGNGGANGAGAIFRVGTNGSAFTTLHNFTGSDGKTPFARLIQGTDGTFYGTTAAGGPLFGGVVFRMVPCAIAQPPVVTVTSCLPANTPGLIASVSGDPADTYRWIVLGGTITAGQGTQTLTFTSGDAGRRMSVQVLETDSNDCVGGATQDVQVDFDDVPPADPFHAYVCTIGRDGITAGCGGGDYCRNDPVRRDQMAVFLLKAEHGAGYVPPSCAGAFPDVPCPGSFTDWIEQLAAEGITGGCSGGNYCPTNPVTRAQMAVFLLKAEHGSSYTPPNCAGIFGDVPCPSQFANWIEQLAMENITAGCGGDNYCPDNPNTRGQMSVFLTKTFGLQ